MSPKSANTVPIVEHYVRDYLIERFGEQIAEDIKPLNIQKWLKSLHEANGLAWTVVSEIRGLRPQDGQARRGATETACGRRARELRRKQRENV